ncbi:uncharacterized protein [Rhodnius prolixus]|uniref:uncharacterized protein n=1 Tax=Rhodnius prolixus TaxID=13249 RepID=UPI003D18BC05
MLFRIIAVVACLAPVLAVEPYGGLGGGGGERHGGYHDEQEQHTEPHYSFEYEVKDPHTQDIKTHKEERQGGRTQGVYELVEADGSKRKVEYTVEGKSGFNVVVHRENTKHPVTMRKGGYTSGGAVGYGSGSGGYSSGGRDYSAVGGDYSSGGKDYSAVGGDYSSGGKDYSARGGEYSSGGRDYSARSGDYSSGGKDFSARGGDYSSGGKDYSARGGDYSAESGGSHTSAGNFGGGREYATFYDGLFKKGSQGGHSDGYKGQSEKDYGNQGNFARGSSVGTLSAGALQAEFGGHSSKALQDSYNGGGRSLAGPSAGVFLGDYRSSLGANYASGGRHNVGALQGSYLGGSGSVAGRNTGASVGDHRSSVDANYARQGAHYSGTSAGAYDGGSHGEHPTSYANFALHRSQVVGQSTGYSSEGLQSGFGGQSPYGQNQPAGYTSAGTTTYTSQSSGNEGLGGQFGDFHGQQAERANQYGQPARSLNDQSYLGTSTSGGYTAINPAEYSSGSSGEHATSSLKFYAHGAEVSTSTRHIVPVKQQTSPY